MFIAGVDYSITSPSLCLYSEQNGYINPNLCSYYFFDNNIERWSTSKNMNSYQYPEYDSDIDRYNKLADFIFEKCIWYTGRVDFVIIEDYAYGASKGRVFNIAENCAILKQKLYQNQIKFVSVPPTNIKKFATGKGNSNKDAMYQTWIIEGGIELPRPGKNPDSDIVDSYFLCKYGLINKDVLISS